MITLAQADLDRIRSRYRLNADGTILNYFGRSVVARPDAQGRKRISVKLPGRKGPKAIPETQLIRLLDNGGPDNG